MNLESHARRVYFCVQSPELASALVLADRIRSRKLKDGFRLADAYRPQWEMLTSRDRVEKAVDVLIDCGWLLPEKPKDEKREGYGVRFRINPRVYEQGI
jgi:hypothetical protein